MFRSFFLSFSMLPGRHGGEALRLPPTPSRFIYFCFYLSKLHLSIWFCLSIFYFGLIVESYQAAVSRKYCLQNSQGCSIHPSIHPSIHRSIYLSIYLPISSFSIDLSFYLFFFLLFFLSFSILPGRHGGEALRPPPNPPPALSIFVSIYPKSTFLFGSVYPSFILV